MKKYTEATNARVEHKGEDYYLTQQVHCYVPRDANYQLQALAENESGKEIMVTWKYTNYLELDGDCDNCFEGCDWDNYEIIEI